MTPAVLNPATEEPIAELADRARLLRTVAILIGDHAEDLDGYSEVKSVFISTEG